MNNLHRAEVEEKYAKPLSADKITPLYDVRELNLRIRMENELKEHSQRVDEHDHIVLPGEN